MKNHSFIQVKNYFSKTYHLLEVINMDSLYSNTFETHFSKETFQFIIGTLCASNSLYEIKNPFYCIPKQTKYGLIESSEQQIEQYFLGHLQVQGIYSGYRLFSKYNLTTQISKSIQIYSNLVPDKGFQYKNIIVKKFPFKITEDNYRLLELLEIIKLHRSIENLSNYRFHEYIDRCITSKNILDSDPKILNSTFYSAKLIEEFKSLLHNRHI